VPHVRISLARAFARLAFVGLIRTSSIAVNYLHKSPLRGGRLVFSFPRCACMHTGRTRASTCRVSHARLISGLIICHECMHACTIIRQPRAHEHASFSNQHKHRQNYSSVVVSRSLPIERPYVCTCQVHHTEHTHVCMHGMTLDHDTKIITPSVLTIISIGGRNYIVR
jgi:hypothetical protein